MITCKFKSTPPSPCKHYIKLEGEAGLCALDHNFHCTEALKVKNPVLSVSSAKDYISCPMKYYYHKIEGIESIPSKLPDPMKAGRIWDEFMNMTYSGPDATNTSFDAAIKESNPADYLSAKLQALIYAFQELGIKVDTATCQKTLNEPILRSSLIGIVDRDYDDYFVETKLSSRPDFYNHIQSIHFQAGTYFLLNPSYDYMILEVTRLPSLKQKSNEDLETFTSRIQSDIIKRPSYYFIGLNRKTMQFGKKFLRSEFNLEYIKRTYRIITARIRDSISNDAWYKNELACYCPSPCQYIPICKTGRISESLFRLQDKRRKIQ